MEWLLSCAKTEKGLMTQTCSVCWSETMMSKCFTPSHFVLLTLSPLFTVHIQVYETPFFVAVDHDKKKVVISIRGTLSPKVIYIFLYHPLNLSGHHPKRRWSTLFSNSHVLQASSRKVNISKIKIPSIFYISFSKTHTGTCVGCLNSIKI